ncbi:glycosyltransferase family 9 protein [Chitinophaga sp. NPDC101104]|uniref:glycosyltransferase family 9 protein n=1 Tax=Chitinophaga sp. NPDC101104 TaxID=3390561 RepID=UPI003D000512
MLNNIRNIAILRALQLGDLLCAVPAFRALRAAFPESEITLLGLPWAAEFVSRFSRYIDHFVHFPGVAGLPEQAPGDFDAFAEAMRAKHFDLLVQMQGSGCIVNGLLPELGAQLTAGFWKPPEDCPNPLSFLPYPEHPHEIHRHLALLQYLGIPLWGDYLEFPITPTDEAEYRLLNLDAEHHQYVCIHPGSRDPSRQWPVEYFAKVADVLAEEGWPVILTGTEGEKELTQAVMQQMQHPAIDLAGRTTLGSLAVLLRGARLLVSNCTGAAHVSYALRTPSVVISMDGEPARWGPLNTALHHLYDWKKDQELGQVIDSAIELSR